ncbi:MAG: DUF2946 family protein [Alcaligenaceae bacterium]|nr:DUF2946 family protein [Alcaligenaceae bacterium]
MDEQVLAAMNKWPNVPAAYGWLSLNERGLWRFHHQGDFAADPAGDTIENRQLIDFLGRNYTVNDRGEWYVQNGPQKAYVTLPHAPLILFYNNSQTTLSTHHDHTVSTIKQWYFSNDGRIFAQTDLGAAMLSGRDAPAFIEDARVLEEDNSIRELDTHDIEAVAMGKEITLSLNTRESNLTAPCLYLESNKAEEILGFVSQPKP